MTWNLENVQNALKLLEILIYWNLEKFLSVQKFQSIISSKLTVKTDGIVFHLDPNFVYNSKIVIWETSGQIFWKFSEKYKSFFSNLTTILWNICAHI